MGRTSGGGEARVSARDHGAPTSGVRLLFFA